MESANTKNDLQDLITRRLIVQAESGEDHAAASDSISSTDEPARIEPPNPAAVATATSHAPTFAKVEKSLAGLGFFTPSSRRIKEEKIKRLAFTRDIEGKRVEVTAEIVPSAMFGLPITADQDKWLALQQIITDKIRTDGKLTNPIRFKSAELLRLLNDSTKSGKNYKDVGEWLDVMSSTTIFSNGVVWAANRKQFAKDRFRVFERAVSVGKEMEDGTIADANYVWLSSWQLNNIDENFLLPIDLETYRELKNHIAKALVPHLQIWLFASQKAGHFEKRYDELCELFALRQNRAPSQIVRQLRPSLNELVEHEYLETWRIEKTADRKAYKVIFVHGPKFHRDRRRRMESKANAEPPVVIASADPTELSLPEPGHLQPSDHSPTLPDSISSSPAVEEESADGTLIDALAARGLMPSAVLKLLDGLSQQQLEQANDYIEYWDTLKQTKDIGPGLLYELIRNSDPLPANFETRAQRETKAAQHLRNKNLGRLNVSVQAQYEKFCRASIDQHIADSLPEGEFERRVAARTHQLAAEPGFWQDRRDMAAQFARHEVRGAIEKSVPVPTLDDYRQRELARILEELKLTPEEVGMEPTNPSKPDAPAHIASEATEAPLQADNLEGAGTLTSEPNSSPAGL